MIRKAYHVSLGSNTTMIQFSCLNSSTQLARGLQIQRPHIVSSGKHRSIPLCLELLEKPVDLNLSRDFLFYRGLTLAAHQRGTKLEVQQEGFDSVLPLPRPRFLFPVGLPYQTRCDYGPPCHAWRGARTQDCKYEGRLFFDQTSRTSAP